MQFVAKRYPAPNDFSGNYGDLLNTAGFRFNAPYPYVENDYVGKLDFDLTKTQHLWDAQLSRALQAPTGHPVSRRPADLALSR